MWFQLCQIDSWGVLRTTWGSEENVENITGAVFSEENVENITGAVFSEENVENITGAVFSVSIIVVQL